MFGKIKQVIKSKTTVKEKHELRPDQLNKPTSLTQGTFVEQSPQVYNTTTQLPQSQGTYGNTNYGTTNYATMGSGLGTVPAHQVVQGPRGTGGIIPSTQGPFGDSIGAPPLGSNIQRKKSSSSSSSSSDEQKRRRKMESNLGPRTTGVETIDQTGTGIRPGFGSTGYETGNIQSGYGQTMPIDTNVYGQTGHTTYTGSNVYGPVLGKNLYGQTGIASTQYSIQQPFPGQNVYVKQPPQKISEQTRKKFEKPVM